MATWASEGVFTSGGLWISYEAYMTVWGKNVGNYSTYPRYALSKGTLL